MKHIEQDIASAIADFVGADSGRSVGFACDSPIVLSAGRNADIARPAASVMKIPLAMAVYDRAQRGALDLDRLVPVSTFGKTRYVSILAAFDKEHTLSLREICRLALITSDNPLAVFLQTLAGFDAVNAVLARFPDARGCTMQAGFSEEDLGPRNRVNILTAHACLALLNEVSVNPSYRDLNIALQNNLRNNRIPGRLPDSAVVAHKTGSLEGVANDAGLVEDGPLRFRIAFLTDRQADTEQTTNDIAACSARIFKALASIPV